MVKKNKNNLDNWELLANIDKLKESQQKYVSRLLLYSAKINKYDAQIVIYW